MHSCSTGTHVLLFSKNACSLVQETQTRVTVEQEYTHDCWVLLSIVRTLFARYTLRRFSWGLQSATGCRNAIMFTDSTLCEQNQSWFSIGHVHSLGARALLQCNNCQIINIWRSYINTIVQTKHMVYYMIHYIGCRGVCMNSTASNSGRNPTNMVTQIAINTTPSHLIATSIGHTYI